MKTASNINGLKRHPVNDFEGYRAEVSEAMEVAVREAETAEREWFEQYRARTAAAQAFANILGEVRTQLKVDEPTSRHKPSEQIPFWKKCNLTIEEAAAYFAIGEKKLRYLVRRHSSKDFFITNGTKVLIKRVKFEQFLNSITSI